MNKVSHGDSYVIVVRINDALYIDAKHYTKKHPSGVTMLYNECINRHIGVYTLRYLKDTLDCEAFEFKRKDGYEFDVIDKRLNRILKHQDYLIQPKSLKCVPSVMEQLSEEYKRLIYDLISFRIDKK